MWKKRGIALAAASLVALAAQLPAGAASRPAYSSSWTSGLKGWAHSSPGWSVSRGVVSYNGSSASDLIAPFRISGPHYVVQATMRLMAWRETGISESHGMGVLVRANGPVDPTGDTAGLMAGLGKGFIGCDGVHSNAVLATADTDFTTVAQDKRAFSAKHAWHSLRVEVNGNTIRLTIDGKLRTTGKSSRFANAPSVGLFSLSARMQVKNFSVEQL